MSEESPIPAAMQWRFKQLKKLLKETVTMTPNNGSSTVRPGQRIIVDLPFNSTVDLSTFTWFFKGQTNHAGAATDGLQGYVRSRFFPRNSSSVIQSMQIKVNGGIKVDIPDYNFVYNMLHDYTQGADALKRRVVGGENSDPSNKLYMVANDIRERRGYSMGLFNVGDDTQNDVVRDRQEYCVRSWLSLLGGNASTNIIDTQMLGIVTIELVLAPASMLILGTNATGYVADLAAADSLVYRQQVGRPTVALVAFRNAAFAEESNDYSLSDLQFRIVRYLMPTEFYSSLSNALGTGKVYKLWFPNYSVYTGNAVTATNKNCTTSFSISTKSLDYVIGTFRIPAYDTPGLVLNTLKSPAASLEVGDTLATAESQISAGCRRIYNLWVSSDTVSTGSPDTREPRGTVARQRDSGFHGARTRAVPVPA